LGYLSLLEYKPEAEINLSNEILNQSRLSRNETIDIVTYNVGYGGMDQDVDFFMDGGTMSRGISKEQVTDNILASIDILKTSDSDLILLQEIDMDSSRSFNVNQYDLLKETFGDYNKVYGINYDVPWIAIPVLKPHGKVLASQVNLSNKYVEESIRVALPKDQAWPRRLADLDRMMLVSKLPVEDGKALYIINAHLSAYDKGGLIRKAQLEFVEAYINKLYKEGHYVIVGGDWNQGLPGVDLTIFETQEAFPDWLVDIPEDFSNEGFDWYYDPQVPTCRNAGAPYKEGYNFLSIIDGFLVSDNIEVIEVQGLDLAFKYSDHNPVKLTFKLK
jgi:endonuclease/exonuclease/phosphatase family metal-dependent hydrolase